MLKRSCTLYTFPLVGIGTDKEKIKKLKVVPGASSSATSCTYMGEWRYSSVRS